MGKDIVIWPSRVLTTRTKKVTSFGKELQKLLEELLESVIAAEGIGIAANQIGVSKRVALVGREDGTFFEIVNPEILSLEEPVELSEGCLSVPGEYDNCPRFHRIQVRYQDREGKGHELAAEGYLAHVLQHEIDHLDGVVFVLKLSELKRGLIRQRMQKLKRKKR